MRKWYINDDNNNNEIDKQNIENHDDDNYNYIDNNNKNDDGDDSDFGIIGEMIWEL